MRARANGNIFASRLPSVCRRDACSQSCVAIFYFDLRAVSRREGDSAVEKWAYATGTRQVDERTGRIYDHSCKAREILVTGKVGPVNWQATERAENRWDAKVARTLILALPHELNLRQQVELMIKYAVWLRQLLGVAIEWSIHEAPGDPRNRHGHLVITTRRVDENGVHGKKTRELDVHKTSQYVVLRLRQRWALTANAALTCAGSSARINWRSLAARGINRPARLHMGPEQAEQHRLGYTTPAGAHNAAVDEIARLNLRLQQISDEYKQLQRKRRRRQRRGVIQAGVCLAHVAVQLARAAAGGRNIGQFRRGHSETVAERPVHSDGQPQSGPDRGHGDDANRGKRPVHRHGR